MHRGQLVTMMRQCGITSIPAILFVKGGQVVDKLVGAQPKANFVKKIEALK